MRSITREIVIHASVARVWKHITDPEKIAGWLMPNDFEAVVGKAFTLDCNVQGKIRCVVKEIVPEQKLVYGFTSPAIKVETTVAITLTAEGATTRVTLVHSGWDAVPPADQGMADMFGEGWSSSLHRLLEQITATNA